MVVGLVSSEGPVAFKSKGSCEVEIGGGLNVVALQLLPAGSENMAAEDVHKASSSNKYTLEVPEAGNYTLKIWVDTKREEVRLLPYRAVCGPGSHEPGKRQALG